MGENEILQEYTLPYSYYCKVVLSEKDYIERKHKFWERLSTEVEEAQENNLAFILQMDGNLWAGKEIIKNDVHDCNQNGKLFHEFLKKYPHLIVINSLDLCKGLITRRRKTTRGLEEAVLDFFVICNKISRFLMKMTIDEEKSMFYRDMENKMEKG